jgi:hypothetical protein
MLRNLIVGTTSWLAVLIGLMASFPSSNSFVVPTTTTVSVQQQQRRIHMSATPTEANVVEQLLEQVQRNEDDSSNQETIQELIHQLSSSSSNATTTTSSTTESSPNDDDDFDFDALIGYYNVSYTLASRPNDNPVGGKWTRNQRLWKIRRTLQHILPPKKNNDGNTIKNSVAQAINIIGLDCLWGLLPIWIVLRGDAVPLRKDDEESEVAKSKLLPHLSPRAVRAYFDAPRIAIGKLVFSFGPTSSVVIDTPYVDDRLRIGIGGTSGTKFVFSRVNDNDKEAIDSWKWLLEQPSILTKKKASWTLAIAAILSGVGLRMSLMTGGVVSKWLTGASTVLSVLGLAWVRVSTGGIESRGDTYTPGK